MKPLFHSAAPRGLITAPRADTGAAEVLRQLSGAFEDFRARQDQRVDALQAGLDQLNTRAIAFEMNGGANAAAPPDPAYTSQWRDFLRSGVHEEAIRAANQSGYRAQVNAAMSEGAPSSGGYVAPVEWDRRIIAAERLTSPIRRLATTIQTGVRGFSTLWSDRQYGSGWVGETAARPQTTTPTFTPITFSSGQIYSNVALTQDLIDDAEVNIEEYVTNELGEEFGRQEGIAFLTGDGVNKPLGILQYVTGGLAAHPGGALDVVPTGDAAGITADALKRFVYGLAAPYRIGASWLMNSTTAAAISTLKNDTGDYIWRDGLAEGQPSTLLGFPVAFDENMDNVAADALPIIFGNFRRGYVVVDRTGVRILRDPYTNKPYVMLYATKRVGGGIRDPRALRVMRVAT